MFERLIKIINYGNFNKIKNSKVLIVGIGGVGGYALECLVRSGVENITIIDGEFVDETNLNRQIIALNSTIGNKKVEVAKKRALDINPNIKIRINTNGHANAIHKRNVAIELAPYIDSISISLNAQNEETYNKVSNPKIENAYEEVKRFIRACVEEKIKTTTTVVSNVPNYPVNVERCEVVAKSLGAKFRAREFITNGY
mgnify:CR=1 FL=1